MKAFIDTWGLKAFIDKTESKHLAVKKFCENIWGEKGKLVTTDYIIDETITLISSRLRFEKVKEIITAIDLACQGGFIEFVWISPEEFEEAKQLRLKYDDKPSISFTDFTTMVVMKEKRITNIVTEDEDFVKVRMGFNVLFRGK